jgi:hypothetical protein
LLVSTVFSVLATWAVMEPLPPLALNVTVPPQTAKSSSLPLAKKS